MLPSFLLLSPTILMNNTFLKTLPSAKVAALHNTGRTVEKDGRLERKCSRAIIRISSGPCLPAEFLLAINTYMFSGNGEGRDWNTSKTTNNVSWYKYILWLHFGTPCTIWSAKELGWQQTNKMDLFSLSIIGLWNSPPQDVAITLSSDDIKDKQTKENKCRLEQMGPGTKYYRV